MKRDIFILFLAYENYIKDISIEKGKVYIVLNSGNKILYDDKNEKSFDEKLSNPDLQDTLEQIYPLYNIDGLMDENFDPGRFRNYDLLKEVYGNSETKIKENLVNIVLSDKNYTFNENNNAIYYLGLVKNKLEVLYKEENYSSYIFPLGGIFNYRTISGTDRLSSHAFGISIDLASKDSFYWKWSDYEMGETEIKNYPYKIVNLFEENMFIWGGKWNHFDIMHFEYRPEIILKGKYFSNEPKVDELWYKDLGEIKKFQEKIDFIEYRFN
jgi:hypothetical protein